MELKDSVRKSSRISCDALKREYRVALISVVCLVKYLLSDNLPLFFIIVFANTVKIMNNGFYSSFICRPILDLLRFM